LLPRTLFLCFSYCLIAQAAAAQTRVYVAGDLFADITRFSRLTAPEVEVSPTLRGLPADDVSAGGGARIGAFFSPAWSLELGADLGATQTTMSTERIGPPILLSPPVPITSIIQPITFETRSSVRFSAISVLIGYHPPASGRIRPGFLGGISIMHRRETFIVASTSFIFESPRPDVTGGLVPSVVVPSLRLNEYTATGNVLTATLAAEAAIVLSDRAAVVPELRVHAGGLGAILIRPGAAVRWRF
jgi:hypothetical protein